MSLRIFLFGLIMVFCGHGAMGQASRYSPFIVDSGAVTATLKVKDASLKERFASVFDKHQLSASSPVDWYDLIGKIAGMRETDLYANNEITFESSEENVELSAINFDNLEQMVKSLRLVIMTPEKVDAFLNEYEGLLNRKR